jgi:hypothetical protein
MLTGLQILFLSCPSPFITLFTSGSTLLKEEGRTEEGQGEAKDKKKGLVKKKRIVKRRVKRKETEPGRRDIRYTEYTAETAGTAKTQYRKFETNILRQGIARPLSELPHSCV